MSTLEHAITTQRANLQRRRQWLRQQKRELRNSAADYCSKPSTLFTAFLAGTVLGVLYPPHVSDKPKHGPIAGAGSILRHHFDVSLQMLIVNAVIRLFTQPKNPVVNENRESAVH